MTDTYPVLPSPLYSLVQLRGPGAYDRDPSRYLWMPPRRGFLSTEVDIPLRHLMNETAGRMETLP